MYKLRYSEIPGSVYDRHMALKMNIEVFLWKTSFNQPIGINRDFRIQFQTSRKHIYIILTPLNPTFL